MKTKTFGGQLRRLNDALSAHNGNILSICEGCELLPEEIDSWERDNLGSFTHHSSQGVFRLPHDLREFLYVSNGFDLQWFLHINTKEHIHR